MNLIIVSGATSTGKSTLARKLAKDLKIPLFLRDDFKEQHFDTFGGKPSLKQLGSIDIASRKKLFSILEDAVNKDTDLIIESNFMYSERNTLQEKLGDSTNVVEIFCRASGRTILKRYTKRYRSGERHRGHRDYLWYPIVAIESLGPVHRRYRPLLLSNRSKIVDTEDFSKIDYPDIVSFIRENIV
ncbi:MAG TPA: AAA family ATPase [Candidatus Saccharimonadales bacterium]